MTHTPRERVLWGLGILVVLLYALIPVVWITSLSLKTPAQVGDRKFLSGFSFDNYDVIFSDDTFLAALINSIGIAGIATLISIVLAAMAAYATSRLNFTGKALILSGALAVAMFPPISIVGSLFDMWRAIGIYDTWIGLIIPYMTFTLPLAIYTLSAFFREIPWELEQAAQVDGATPFQAFRKIIVPLAASRDRRGVPMAQITMEGITKRYPDGYEAVRDMDLDIADGEFVILVGPSGCGKSTALRMIAGLEDITEGELRIGDEVVNDRAPKDRDIAMVFQNYALYPHMSVRQNMGFALQLRGTDKEEIDRKVTEAAQILDLEAHLDRKPSQLSGGQRQRGARGGAVVRAPAAFLRDEPLSNLDAKLRVQMRTEVSRIQQRLGTTTVYVTHDQTEAMTLGDRVAVMRAGTLQQVG